MSEFENEYTWGKAISSNSTDNFHADFEKAIDIRFEISDEIAEHILQYDYQWANFETGESESRVRK